MSREDDLWPGQSPRSGSYNCVVARHVRVNDIEFAVFEMRPEPHRCEDVSGIQERQFDPRRQGAAMPACNDNIVTALSKMSGEFDDVCFSATPGRRRTNLQNAHCELQNPR